MSVTATKPISVVMPGKIYPSLIEMGQEIPQEVIGLAVDMGAVEKTVADKWKKAEADAAKKAAAEKAKAEKAAAADTSGDQG